METFSALLVICAGNSPVPGEFPTQRPVTQSFDVFFDLRLNKWLSKHWRGWWFETPSRPLWRHCNAIYTYGQTRIQCFKVYTSQANANSSRPWWRLEMETFEFSALLSLYKGNPPVHKRPITRKMFPFDDVIMSCANSTPQNNSYRKIVTP